MSHYETYFRANWENIAKTQEILDATADPDYYPRKLRQKIAIRDANYYRWLKRKTPMGVTIPTGAS